MKKMYLWEVEYQVSGTFTTSRTVRVVSSTDSYGEAERLALEFINKQLKDSGFSFDFIANINQSQVVFAGCDAK